MSFWSGYTFSSLSPALFFVSGVCSLFVLGCEEPIPEGYLQLNSTRDGTYEIYRYASEKRAVFISEQVGHFNQQMTLSPGSYLVLADCSSETVTIYPGQSASLAVHTVDFIPPREPGHNDSFSLQCSRSKETRSRQSFSNRFSLNLIHGAREVLVGMVPLAIDFSELSPDQRPLDLEYRLSAVQVASVDEQTLDATYFVSLTEELIAVTKPQTFGAWEFLLPGSYTLEVNGTTLDVTLREADEHVVLPSFVKVSVSDAVDLEQPSRVNGTPQLVEINSGHWLSFNEVYPVLPGTASLRVSGSSRKLSVDLLENQLHEVQAQSVQVDLGCSPWEWTCLGGKAISLYQGEQPYPFIESVSDIPIIFFAQNDEPVFAGVEGSRDIRYQLPLSSRDTILRVGYVHFVPRPSHKPGQITDLVRFESVGPPSLGDSLDLNLESPKVLPLIAGSYHLAHYLSMTSQEGDRRRSAKFIRVVPRETQTVDIPVFFSEKKLAAYKKVNDSEQLELEKTISSKFGGRALPLSFF